MEKVKLSEHSASLVKIELNKQGDYTAISLDDSTLFDRFVAGFKHLAQLSDEMPDKIAEIEKKYADKEDFSSAVDRTLEISKVNVSFSEEASKVVDGIFGADTLKKYFRNIYEEIPEFLPDADCILEFFEKITPEMEKLFDRKVEARTAASKARMAKYHPQDHKKPVSKATKK